MKTEKGTVKFFNQEKGFGFIIPEQGGADVFVHVTNCRDDIKQEDSVTFKREQGKKGEHAVEVELEA
jgi:CspA family cold shock protein